MEGMNSAVTSNEGELRGYYHATDSELKRRTEIINRLENCVVRLSGSSPIVRDLAIKEDKKIPESVLRDLECCHKTDISLNQDLYSLIEKLETLI